jgi:hypothetical protein
LVVLLLLFLLGVFAVLAVQDGSVCGEGESANVVSSSSDHATVRYAKQGAANAKLGSAGETRDFDLESAPSPSLSEDSRF